jgi:hypothetical protein
MKKKLMKRNIKIINNVSNVSILVNVTISLNNSNNNILGCSLLIWIRYYHLIYSNLNGYNIPIKGI